ncbi:rolling circle replication-associated protein [Tsuneonella suprasediminis]|uniref:rolling circle replication-associated protein n=1 Tax=Tsuneonella suprasediminis TaxID=2306996 RepID=UPI003BEF4ABD
MHGDCADPVYIEYTGHEDAVLSRIRQWKSDESIDYIDGFGHIGGYRPAARQTAYLSVRCRKCGPCLKQRAKVWATRGAVELRAATRSWFGTLTYSPEQRFRVRCEADRPAYIGSPWSSLNTSEQFKEMAKVTRRDYQLFLKRVRKASRARIRYLMTTEAHADGFPHLHVLLHEYEGKTTKRLLDEQWRHGFTKWKVVDANDVRVPWYVAKYLTKSILARPCASLRYGQPPLEALTEQLHTVGRAVATRPRCEPQGERDGRNPPVVKEGKGATMRDMGTLI